MPTTREFGKRFGVANTTVFRVLQRLTRDGEIWQHPTSGRYYPATARALLDRPKPVACLIRRLKLGSEQYRELLEGISQGCGALHRTMLLWHDELLVNHPDPHEPPIFAPVAQQRAILNNFVDRHGEAAGGFVLDHLWSDEALRVETARLQPAVVLFRSCGVESYSNIRADFRSGALKALAHLLGRGFEQIIPVEPFAGDLAVAEFGAALAAAADELGCRGRLGATESGGTNRERAAVIERLRRASRRAAVVCPEDNVTALLAQAASDAGLRCPERVGLLSVMGTDLATKAGISCLRYDFRAMGRMAVDALGNAGVVRHLLEPQFSAGVTT
ncbi:MAG: LacI family DNA-binding transcriptional regulator [Verrucomicrobia bacterium]|nr:LacI family DNA-binding transcriptional regulator [Verrucomicrobiota bacterium]